MIYVLTITVISVLYNMLLINKLLKTHTESKIIQKDIEQFRNHLIKIAISNKRGRRR